MTGAYITARTPDAVAREVESLSRAGNHRFILRVVDRGGMLDQAAFWIGATYFQAS